MAFVFSAAGNEDGHHFNRTVHALKAVRPAVPVTATKTRRLKPECPGVNGTAEVVPLLIV
jgi:hypothetical protein